MYEIYNLAFGLMAITKGLLVPSRHGDLSFHHCMQTDWYAIVTGKFCP
jgi:hypothetical protein